MFHAENEKKKLSTFSQRHANNLQLDIFHLTGDAAELNDSLQMLKHQSFFNHNFNHLPVKC